jgi:hypothetical protein
MPHEGSCPAGSTKTDEQRCSMRIFSTSASAVAALTVIGAADMTSRTRWR